MQLLYVLTVDPERSYSGCIINFYMLKHPWVRGVGSAGRALIGHGFCATDLQLALSAIEGVTREIGIAARPVDIASLAGMV